MFWTAELASILHRKYTARRSPSVWADEHNRHVLVNELSFVAQPPPYEVKPFGLRNRCSLVRLSFSSSKIYVQCRLIDAILLFYLLLWCLDEVEPVKNAFGQNETGEELKLCWCVVFHTPKVRSFHRQTYLEVYVYVTLCHGSLQVSQ